jgi:hypothetical protein
MVTAKSSAMSAAITDPTIPAPSTSAFFIGRRLGWLGFARVHHARSRSMTTPVP